MPSFRRKLKSFRNKTIENIAYSACWKSTSRAKLLRLTGMKIGKSHIGSHVEFDTNNPENIEIGDYCAITSGVSIITHYVHMAKNQGHWYTYGKVKIGNNVHIGMNASIVHPVTIGDDVIIGAGAVVTKDIPSGEVWGGVPARFIKKVEGY